MKRLADTYKGYKHLKSDLNSKLSSFHRMILLLSMIKCLSDLIVTRRLLGGKTKMNSLTASMSKKKMNV